jgi:hypothetical protein
MYSLQFHPVLNLGHLLRCLFSDFFIGHPYWQASTLQIIYHMFVPYFLISHPCQKLGRQHGKGGPSYIDIVCSVQSYSFIYNKFIDIL